MVRGTPYGQEVYMLLILLVGARCACTFRETRLPVGTIICQVFEVFLLLFNLKRLAYFLPNALGKRIERLR